MIVFDARRTGLLVCLLSLPFVLGQARSSGPGPLDCFVDATARAGLTFTHQSGATPEKRMVETFGSGVAWIDYDNDGFPDLYFVNGAPGAPSALYHNNKDGTFSDVTARAGLAGNLAPGVFKTGVAVGDYDNDGDLDLYVTALGPNTLYRNNGDGTFTDVTAAAGVAGDWTEWSTSTGFFDFDRDGDLDLYVVNYLDYRLDDSTYCGLRKPGYRMYCHPSMFDGKADRLFRNNGDGTFTDVSKQAGIANPAGKGLGVTFCDFDRDGDQDVYVANDTVRNFLYRNNGDGTFTDVAYGAGVGFDGNGKPQAGMGVDCADIDGNGFPDIFVTNFSEELNTLYVNHGDGTFDDGTVAAGLRSGFVPLGFGTKFYDVDSDGDLDIHVTNGHVIDNVELPAEPHLQADGPVVREPRRRQVSRRVCRGGRRAADGARRPRPRCRRLRQRRQPRRRHHERGAAPVPPQEHRRPSWQLDHHPRAGHAEQHVGVRRDGRDHDRRRPPGPRDLERGELPQ